MCKESKNTIHTQANLANQFIWKDSNAHSHFIYMIGDKWKWNQKRKKKKKK